MDKERMACYMNKNKMIRTFMIIAIVVFFITNTPAMAGTVDTLVAQYDINTGVLYISGSASLIEKNTITMEVFNPNGTLLYFATATLAEDGTFSKSIRLGTLSQGNYMVRSADYVGGTYKTTAFTIVAPDTGLPQDVVILEPPITEVVDESVKSTVTVISETNSQGVLTGTVTGSDLSKIETSSTSKIEIFIDNNSDPSKAVVVFETSALTELNSTEFSKVVIDMPMATLSFDQSFFDALSLEGDKELSISAENIDPNRLSEEMQKVVGEQPVFDFKVIYGEDLITEFDKPILITIPYALKADENPDNIIIYYLKDNGEIETISNCLYNEESKSVAFSTYHFSYFYVGYEAVTFTDVSKIDSYYESVNFIAARGITNGVGNNKFGPQNNLTRAQFMVMLFRAYGIMPSENATSNFSDAGNAYYTPYLAKAKALGISNGTGDNKFLPDNKITIQEIYTLVYRTLKMTNQLPDLKNTSQLSVFSDEILIDLWARNPVKELLNRGILDDQITTLTPERFAMRFDMAEILYEAFYSTFE